VPVVDLPGYEVKERNLIVNGICKECKN
jgi:hypothetical protein